MSGRKIFRLLLDTVSVVGCTLSAWGLGRAWLSGEADVMAGLAFTPGFAIQVYAGLVAGFLFFIVSRHWELLQSCRPSRRFKALHPSIQSLRRHYGDLVGYESEIEALRLNLTDIRIHGPAHRKMEELKKRRFKALHPSIQSLRRHYGDLVGYESEIEALRLNLRDIRIHGPDPFEDIEDWEWRLKLLDAYSKDGRIKEAKNLFGNSSSISSRLMRIAKKGRSSDDRRD